MAISNIKALLPVELHKVWDFVLDIENYAAWRSDLSKTEFDMENDNMKGHWTGIFTAKGNETEIDFTELVEAKKLLLKPFVKLYLKKQQTQFVADIRKTLGGM